MRFCHRFPVRNLVCELTEGYASLTSGYYPITPTGFQNESLRDFITGKMSGHEIHSKVTSSHSEQRRYE